MEIKNELLKEEHRVLSGCERLSILNSIFEGPFTYYKLNSNKRQRLEVLFSLLKTRDYSRYFTHTNLNQQN